MKMILLFRVTYKSMLYFYLICLTMSKQLLNYFVIYQLRLMEQYLRSGQMLLHHIIFQYFPLQMIISSHLGISIYPVQDGVCIWMLCKTCTNKLMVKRCKYRGVVSLVNLPLGLPKQKLIKWPKEMVLNYQRNI